MERIDHVNQLGDIVDVTKNLYEMSREIARMEAEVYELKQSAAITNEARKLLDDWVRYEASVREKQQKNAVQSVIDKVLAQIEDEEVQKTIMNQALRDIESGFCGS
jgi:F-type H+-transporting ATPase subunit b